MHLNDLNKQAKEDYRVYFVTHLDSCIVYRWLWAFSTLCPNLHSVILSVCWRCKLEKEGNVMGGRRHHTCPIELRYRYRCTDAAEITCAAARTARSHTERHVYLPGRGRLPAVPYKHMLFEMWFLIYPTTVWASPQRRHRSLWQPLFYFCFVSAAVHRLWLFTMF